MAQVEITVKGIFEETDILEFAIVQGYEENISTPDPVDPLMPPTITPNPQTPSQYVEAYFKKLCGGKISDLLFQKNYLLQEMALQQQMQQMHQAIISNVENNITTSNQIVTP